MHTTINTCEGTLFPTDVFFVGCTKVFLGPQTAAAGFSIVYYYIIALLTKKVILNYSKIIVS